MTKLFTYKQLFPQASPARQRNYPLVGQRYSPTISKLDNTTILKQATHPSKNDWATLGPTYLAEQHIQWLENFDTRQQTKYSPTPIHLGCPINEGLPSLPSQIKNCNQATKARQNSSPRKLHLIVIILSEIH